MELSRSRFRTAALAASAAIAFASLPGPFGAPGSAHSSTTSPLLTYVVQATPGQVGAAAAAVRRAGGRVLRTMASLDSATVQLSSAMAEVVARDSRVVAVSPDATMRLASVSGDYDAAADQNSLYNVEQAVGARQIWKTATGDGVDIAVIDSGVSPVPGLDDAAKLVNGPDLSFDSQSDDLRYRDGFGHGTHLAGIIAGHDAGVTAAGGTSNTTAFLGMAPDARIVSVKVADLNGAADVSQVIAGIDWVVQHAHTDGLNIRVINLSFATDSTQGYRLDPLAHAAEVAWRNGIVVVAAAGNRGVTDGRLADPAIDPFVIAVGASDGLGTSSRRDDTVPSFSSRGDGARNPDLVAPGAHVQSLRVPGSAIDAAYGETGGIGTRYQRGSGTSQATAVVSGAVALLAQARPSYSPDRIKALLRTTAYPLCGPGVAAQGEGLLNLRTALSTYVSPSTAQTFAVSSGAGTLEAARGEFHVSHDGVDLTGETDVMGSTYDAPAIAGAEEAKSAWSDGIWNGATWAGSGWESNSWASSSWASSSWASSSWASSSWASSSWASSSWASSSWASSAWAGAEWR